MIQQIVKFKSILALLTFWLLCQNTYAHPSSPDINISQLSESANIGYELPVDTLTKEEQKRIEATKRREETQQLQEIRETEMMTAKEKERFDQENRPLTVYKKSPVKERKHESSTKNERAVVFGIRAGVNIASLGLNSAADGKCSMVTSFHAGLSLDIRLVELLHLNTSLLFSQKGYKYEHDWDRERQETAKAQFVMLPVQLSLRLGFFQINAGSYVEYGFGGEIEYGRRGWKRDTFDYYEAFNYGITAGAGFNIGKRFYLGANYEMGLSDYANRNVAICLGVNF